MAGPNLRVLMKRHPDGMVRVDDFTLEHAAMPEPGAGQVLVRNLVLSLDPYMRPRMDPLPSYAPPLAPGELMPGGAVGEVIDSRDDALPNGTLVAAPLGWQSFGLATKATVRVLDPALGPPSAALGVLGMPGVTAHYGLTQIGRPRAGETVVVSAASGAVGGVVGQIARIRGARAVGIAGGERKCRYVVEELGFDACVDYRASDFAERLAAATPAGVDVLFENVGGPVMDAVLGRINDFARIALCGNISDYNRSEPYGLKGMRALLMHRVAMQAFIIADQRAYWAEALPELSSWLAAGRLRYREDVAEGLEHAPEAFIRMLTGANFGKQLVRVAA